MLQSIDTLIAFVTILTICSLIVLTVVQMISATLSLRGKNMANALALSFQTVAPDLSKQAHALAQRIMSDPLLSDSVHPVKNVSGAEAEGELTIIPFGLGLLGQWMSKGGGLRLANGIRPEEVLAALKRLAAQAPVSKVEALAAAQTAVDAARRRLAAAPNDQALITAVTQAEGQVKALLTTTEGVLLAAASLLKDVSKNTEQYLTDEKLAAVKKVLNSLPTDELKQQLTDAIGSASKALVDVVQSAESELMACIATAQDRAQQWFTTHTRGFTIAASIVFAVFCQLDAVEVFRLVSSSDTTRNAIAQAGSQLARKAELLDDPKGGLLKRVIDAWNADTKHTQLLLKDFGNVGQVRSKIETDQKSELRVFDTLVDAQRDAYFKEQQAKVQQLEAITDAVGFQIFPKGGLRWAPAGALEAAKTAAPDSWCQRWESIGNWLWNFGSGVCHHLIGIGLFAALLTLGAPFWFNSLAKLANLRPALAQLIGDEQAKAKSGA